MIAVIFEVLPTPGKRDSYLDLAAKLRPLLEEIDGFISVERFESLTIRAKSCHCRSFAMRRQSKPGGTGPNTERHRATGGRGFSPTTGCASPPSSATTA